MSANRLLSLGALVLLLLHCQAVRMFIPASREGMASAGIPSVSAHPYAVAVKAGEVLKQVCNGYRNVADADFQAAIETLDHSEQGIPFHCSRQGRRLRPDRQRIIRIDKAVRRLWPSG